MSDDGAEGLETDGEGRLALATDELAGVVDLFGGLTRAELDEALGELAFRAGVEPPPDDAVDAAVREYALVAYPRGEGEGADPWLVPGPAAFPTLPEGAADLPHILDIESRAVDREALGRAVEERFRGDVARAVASEDTALVERLLDVSYDLETWGPVELGDLRERLDAVRDG